MANVKFEFILNDEAAENICFTIRHEINRMKFAELLKPGEYTKAELDHMKRGADLMEKDLEIMCKGSSKVD